MKPVFALTTTLVLSVLPVYVFASVVITDVRVIDVASGTVSEPRDVEIESGRIIAIRAPSPQPRADGRVDGAGRYLVPGYADMHVHVNDPRLAEHWLLPMLLSAGITTVRDMSGDCWKPGCANNIAFMRSLQRRLTKGELAGPRIVAISSAIVDGPRAAEPGMPDWASPATAAQSRRMVDIVRQRGADLIKTYDSIPRAAYFALMERAQAMHLQVGGHVPMSVTLLEAVRAGQRTVDHAKHPAIECSRFSRTFHEVFAAWAAGDSERIYSNSADDEPGHNLGGYYRSILATYDPQICREVIAGFAHSGAYYVPTLITRRFESRANEEEFLADSRLASVPRTIRELWLEDSSNYKRRFENAEEKRAYVELYELSVRLTGEVHRAGVPILVGTDTPDSYSFPGSGYHDELHEMSRAGLSNASVLRAATEEAARYLGTEKEAGKVAVGAVADLVLLEANPLDDISAMSRIVAVIANGRLFDRAALDELERGATQFAQRVGGQAPL